jgi:hypothetical protein
MTKNWVAVVSALLVAGACQAGGASGKDKDAPTTFATTVGCTIPPVVSEPSSDCCKCREGHPHLAKVKAWLCFVPLRTCPCECTHCTGCHPPLYVYFFRPCVEGAGCLHYTDNCSSCAAKHCATCGGCAHSPCQTPPAACAACGTCK